MKYIELANMFENLKKLSVAESNIPIKTGLKIYKNLTTIQNLLIPYEKMRNEIITKYSNGKGSISPGDDNYDACCNDLNELMEQDIKVKLEMIKPSEIDGFSLPMNQITALFPMIEEGEENG